MRLQAHGPDIPGLLDGLYPCVAEKLLDLTEFEFSVVIPASRRRREVEADLVKHREKARVSLAEGKEPKEPWWELRRTVSDLLEGDAEMQELHCMAALELEHLMTCICCQ